MLGLSGHINVACRAFRPPAFAMFGPPHQDSCAVCANTTQRAGMIVTGTMRDGHHASRRFTLITWKKAREARMQNSCCMKHPGTGFVAGATWCGPWPSSPFRGRTAPMTKPAASIVCGSRGHTPSAGHTATFKRSNQPDVASFEVDHKDGRTCIPSVNKPAQPRSGHAQHTALA